MSSPHPPVDDVAGALDRVGQLLTGLHTVDLQTLPSQQLLDTVRRVETLQRQLEGLSAKALAAAEADGLWATTRAALRRLVPQRQRAAHRHFAPTGPPGPAAARPAARNRPGPRHR